LRSEEALKKAIPVTENRFINTFNFDHIYTAEDHG
jgi:hypothetical protein